jgi:hypothetical protein
MSSLLMCTSQREQFKEYITVKRNINVYSWLMALNNLRPTDPSPVISTWMIMRSHYTLPTHAQDITGTHRYRIYSLHNKGPPQTLPIEDWCRPHYSS